MSNDNNQTPEENEETPSEETPNSKGTEEEETSENINKGDASNPEIDYKQKFSDSKDEAIRLLHENQELKTKLVKANETSEEEVLPPNYDLLTDTEKTMSKKQIELEREILKMKEHKAWEDDLLKAQKWANDNEYSFEGKETKFKEFCYSEDNKGIKNIITLVKSFFFDEKIEVDEKVEMKRPGLEKGTGGQHIPSKKGKYSVEEVAKIRTSNPKLYKKMLLEGRIKAKNIEE